MEQALGGVIVDSGKFDWEASGKFASLSRAKPELSRHQLHKSSWTGSICYKNHVQSFCVIPEQRISPFNSFLFLQGLETLSLRVERHVENALKVVQYLNNHPQVERVHHPSVSDDPKQQALYKKYFPNGGGSIFTFEIKGDAAESKRLHRQSGAVLPAGKCCRCKISGDPSGNHHAQPVHTRKNLLDQGIKPNTIRLSIGTENIDDIIEDLDEAFQGNSVKNEKNIEIQAGCITAIRLLN